MERRRATVFAAVAVVVIALAAVLGLISGGSGDDDGTPVAEPSPLASLSLKQIAGQRLIAGFDGTEPPKTLLKMLAAGELAGVILFADNIGDRGSTRGMTDALQEAAAKGPIDDPLLVMVDQEGGEVSRIVGPPVASAEGMARRGADFAAEQGGATAALLRDYGINVDLAPVLDLARPGSAIADERRSFGSRPGEVIDLGVDGFAAGLRDGGIAATAKHFPGLGAAGVNTDFDAQTISLPRKKLRADEEPFAAFADSGGELVMLGLASYSAFGNVPAALVPEIATGELRGRLVYGGVSITDTLSAAAAQAGGDRTQVALAAAGAGSDLLLYGDPRTAAGSLHDLVAALRSGDLERAPFRRSAARVLALRADVGDG
jgi:beta-N-acetylhexosaminidase